MSGILFEDIFNVKDIDPEGKMFDRVSRLHCRSEFSKMDMILDINNIIYPIELGDTFRLVLTTTLSEDEHSDEEDWSVLNLQVEESRAANFDYVMFGKVYRIEENEAEETDETVAVYVSFGGLLMKLQGNGCNLQKFMLGQKLYLLMKKVQL